MKKALLGFVFALALLGAGEVSAATFSDVPDDYRPYKEAINYAAENGIVSDEVGERNIPPLGHRIH